MKFFTIIILLFLIASCTHKRIDSSSIGDNCVIEKRDSVATLLIQFQQVGDTALLTKGLALNSEILKMDTTRASLFYDLNTRIQLLGSLGRYKEAFLLKDKVITKDTNNIDRVIYDAMRYDVAGKADSAQYLYFLAIKKCDDRLKDTLDINTVTNKLSIYTFQGKRKEVKLMLEELLKTSPDNEMLKSLNEDSDRLSEMNQHLRKVLSEK